MNKTQEPVYQTYNDWCCGGWTDVEKWQYEEAKEENRRILYTHPAPAWHSLSDDVVMQTYLFIFNEDESEPDEQVIQFYKLIEQELRTKNGFSDVKEKNHG